MKIKTIVGKIYEPREGTSLRGDWKNLDVVLRNEEEVQYDDGGTTRVMELIAIRIYGAKVDKFLAEVKAGDYIEAVIRPNCEERTSEKGNQYVCNDMVFACPEWKTIRN